MIYDIWATADLVEILKARQDIANGLPKAAFVISRAIKNTKLGKEVVNALSEYEIPILKSVITQLVVYPTTASKEVVNALSEYEIPILKSVITQLVVYPTTASKGLSVLSSEDNTAITEIKNLLDEIKNFLIGDYGVKD